VWCAECVERDLYVRKVTTKETSIYGKKSIYIHKWQFKEFVGRSDWVGTNAM